jgi:hypothetical protein
MPTTTIAMIAFLESLELDPELALFAVPVPVPVPSLPVLEEPSPPPLGEGEPVPVPVLFDELQPPTELSALYC